jgi:hypothetical protein
MARDTAEDQLNERAQHLLKVLVESYIREGQPVGSRTLSRDSGLNLSAATVRNVMADLEEYVAFYTKVFAVERHKRLPGRRACSPDRGRPWAARN